MKLKSLWPVVQPRLVVPLRFIGYCFLLTQIKTTSFGNSALSTTLPCILIPAAVKQFMIGSAWGGGALSSFTRSDTPGVPNDINPVYPCSITSTPTSRSSNSICFAYDPASVSVKSPLTSTRPFGTPASDVVNKILCSGLNSLDRPAILASWAIRYASLVSCSDFASLFSASPSFASTASARTPERRVASRVDKTVNTAHTTPMPDPPTAIQLTQRRNAERAASEKEENIAWRILGFAVLSLLISIAALAYARISKFLHNSVIIPPAY